MKHCVLSTFNKAGYDSYGKNFLSAFKTYWPKDVTLIVYLEGMNLKNEDNVIYLKQEHTLNKLKRFKFENRGLEYSTGSNPWNPAQKGFFWDALKFSNKVFAVCHAISQYQKGYDQLIWLDADTLTRRKIDISFLDDVAPNQNELVAYLNRAIFPECGWVGYNLKHRLILKFARDFEDIYLSGNYRFLRESHDSYVFQRLIESYVEKYGVTWRALGDDQSVGHVFLNSILGKYLDHLKGPKRKRLGSSQLRDLGQTTEAPVWMERCEIA